MDDAGDLSSACVGIMKRGEAMMVERQTSRDVTRVEAEIDTIKADLWPLGLARQFSRRYGKTSTEYSNYD